MKKELLQSVRGMRDFFPPEMRKRNHLFEIWGTVADQFGFEPYDASVVESLALLERKAGEEVADQIYGFVDKSGRELALRPEMTPTLSRMVLSRVATLTMPIKWHFIGQCFRYERMTTGRKREHYQLNLDVIGESSQIAEAEVIAAAISVLKNLGLTSQEVSVLIGSRQLLSDILTKRGFSEQEMQSVFMAIDKRGKMPDSEIAGLLKESGMAQSKVDEVFSVLALDGIDEITAYIGERTTGVRQMESFLGYANAFGISDFVKLDLSIVRGLAYYTGIVFECFDRDRKFRAIFGGGRYDNLFSQMGGIGLPAVGLGFGDVVIEEVLKYYNKEILADRKLDFLVAYTDPELEQQAIKLATVLRAKPVSVYLLFGAQRMKKILKFASQNNASQVAILDPKEVSSGKYLLKSLSDGSQSLVNL